MNLDINTLTIAEIEAIEDETDVSIDELFNSNKKAKGLRVLAWIMTRRENPSFTYEEAGNLPISAIQDLSGKA